MTNRKNVLNKSTILALFADYSENCCTFAAVEHQNATNMANVATLPQEGQLIVSVENVSMLKDLKKAIGMMRGVTKITIPRHR